MKIKFDMNKFDEEEKFNLILAYAQLEKAGIGICCTETSCPKEGRIKIWELDTKRLNILSEDKDEVES